MVVRQKVFIYVTSFEEPDTTLLFKRRIANEMPVWSLLKIVLEYEKENKQSFNQDFLFKIKECIQLGSAHINLLDLSSKNELWAVLTCNNASFNKHDAHCLEINTVTYDRLPLLPASDNLREFLQKYPSYDIFKDRIEQSNNTRKH